MKFLQEVLKNKMMGEGDSIAKKRLQQPLVVPATQADLEALIFEGEVSPTRFVDRQFLANGAHSKVYRAIDTKTGRVVALKKHNHYFPSEKDATEKEIRLAGQRFENEVYALSRLGQGHPGIVQAYGFYVAEEDGEKVPYLVMELLEGDSLGDQIRKNKVFSEDDGRELILSVGAVLDYIHNGNGKKIIYRDLKPQNIFPMPEDASYPHRLVDFSETKLGDATLFSGSVLGTPGYSSPETWGGGEANTTSDFYSLGRIVLAMALQNERKFKENWNKSLSLDALRQNGDLRVSDEFFRVIQKATEENPENRYQNFIELSRGLGYNISRAPQTRQELEAIIGHKGLPVAVSARTETKPVEQRQNGREIGELPEVVENGDGTLTIRGINPLRDFKIEGSVYQTAKAIKNSWGMVYDEGKTEIVGDINNSQKSRALLAYLQHAAQEHPVLQEVIDGKKTLEDAVREKKPDVLSTFSYLFSREVEKHDLKLFLKYIRHSAALLRETEGNKATFDERRKDLYGVLGMNERNFSIRGNLGKAVLGEFVLGVASPFAYVAQTSPTNVGTMATLFGGALFGLLSGGYLGIQHEKRKLLLEAREMDSWIREARVSQGLEKRVEKVELIDGEKEEIVNKSALWSLVPSGITGLSVFNELVRPLVNSDNLNSGNVVAQIAVTTVLGILSSYSVSYFGLNKYLTSSALKQKRLANGLDKDGMMEYKTVKLREQTGRNAPFVGALKDFGLKKKFLRNRLVGEDVAVRYSGIIIHNDDNGTFYSDVTIYAKPGAEERAKHIAEILELDYGLNKKIDDRIYSGGAGKHLTNTGGPK